MRRNITYVLYKHKIHNGISYLLVNSYIYILQAYDFVNAQIPNNNMSKLITYGNQGIGSVKLNQNVLLF